MGTAGSSQSRLKADLELHGHNRSTPRFDVRTKPRLRLLAELNILNDGDLFGARP